MGNTHEERNQFIAHTRDLARDVLAIRSKLEALVADWNGGMSTWLVDASGSDPDAQDYEGEDFTPNHEGLMKADVISAFVTFNTILAAITTGDITNLVNIKRYP